MKTISRNYFNFKAWFEDQMQAANLDLAGMAAKLKVSNRKMGRLIRNTDSWSAQETKDAAEALGLDWWNDFMVPLRAKGLKNSVMLDEADALLQHTGDCLDRVAYVA